MTGELRATVERHLVGPPPHVVGIGGAVAVGKSTIAEDVAAAFSAVGRRSVVVATDAFLLPNAVLAERVALYRKGFPETYDWDAIDAFVRSVKAGQSPIQVPVYSHLIYDIVPGEQTVIEAADLVVFEGVVALQERVAASLDATIYVDADEDLVKGWFVERFLRLTEEARAGAQSFYRLFADMSDAEVVEAAAGTWDAINGVNLHEHIAETKSNAVIVVTKAAGHRVVAIDDRR
jgi:type I pantothenate kinase